MTAFALNNLWSYLQGLSLAKSDREWLASKLIEPVIPTEEIAKPEIVAPAVVGKRHRMRKLSPEVEYLSKLQLREFTQEELDADPLLAAVIEDRRLRK